MSGALGRPLSGNAVGLSISESQDSARLGFPPWQVNRVSIQVAAALMGQGVGVVFGHDWREDGVMEAVHALALRMQSAPLDEQSGTVPLLRNILPWPDAPSLPEADREQLAPTLAVEQAGLPADVLRLLRDDGGEPNQKYIRARALTHLRRRLEERTDARLCLGGRTRGSKGRYPGVIEEAYLSMAGCKPIYLAGFLGGATRMVIDAVEGRAVGWELKPDPALVRLYDTFPGGGHPDLRIDPEAVWRTLRMMGPVGLSRNNGLSEDENVELFHTPAVERVMQLVLLGLARRRSK